MSETYRSLTRKYRPHSFEDIVSQEHVSNTLLNAIKQNRLSHAYMFCGPRGVGKTTMARVLARVINDIDAHIDSEALNQTLNIIEMDAASNNKVEDVHHLRESVRVPPQNVRYKVFIVDEVHMLSKQAFNALLKTLEEPPEYAIFIFATTEPHKILPTILSRVQRFDFKRISVQEIVQRLRKISHDEHIRIDDESLHVIAQKADGALRDALGLMDQAIAFCGDDITHTELLKALNVVGTERVFQFMDCVKNRSADEGLELIHRLLQEGYDIQEFLIGLTEHLRNLYIAHHSSKLYLVEASEETKKKYLDKANDFSRDDLMRMLHMVNEVQIKLKNANQPRIQFEILLLKLIHMEKSEQLARLLVELEELKKKSHGSGATLEQEIEEPKAQEVEPVLSVNPERGEALLESVSAFKSATSPTTSHVGHDVEKPVVPATISSKVEVDQNTNGNGIDIAKGHSDEYKVISSNRKLVLEEVKAVWPQFLKSLIDRGHKILELQVQRATPQELKGHELILAVENPFAQRMLEEQEMELLDILKEHIGVRLRFKTKIEDGGEQKRKILNPYEQFKEIQQKDPILRELVERFGAELEY